MAQGGEYHWAVSQGHRPSVATEATQPRESVGSLLQARHLSDRHLVAGSSRALAPVLALPFRRVRRHWIRAS